MCDEHINDNIGTGLNGKGFLTMPSGVQHLVRAIKVHCLSYRNVRVCAVTERVSSTRLHGQA